MATFEKIRGERRAEARRTLEGYRSICAMHDGILRLMEDADSRLLSTTAQMGETVASTSAGDAIGGGLAKLESASEKLRRTDERICARLDMTLWLVERVIGENPYAGRVLAERYLSRAGVEPTLEEIAEKLCYSHDWTRHLHLVGLDIAADLLECDTLKHMDE